MSLRYHSNILIFTLLDSYVIIIIRIIIIFQL